MNRFSYAIAAVLAASLTVTAISTGCINRGGGLHNFGLAAPGVYRGAQPSTNALKTLAALGVKTVLDLTDGSETHAWEERFCKLQGLEYRHVPMDGLSAPPSYEMDDAFKVLVLDPRPVFVHCVYGSDRTSAVIAAWKRFTFATDKDELLAEAKAYGLEVPGIVTFIKKLP